MSKTPEGLSPGDSVLDTFGNPIVQYFAPGARAISFASHDTFRKLLADEITSADYAANLILRSKVIAAFYSGGPLPEGITIQAASEETIDWLETHAE